MDFGMGIPNWSQEAARDWCDGALAWRMAQTPRRFHWEVVWCRGTAWRDAVACKRCLSLPHFGSIHIAADGARVALVQAVAVLRVDWQVALRQWLMGVGVVTECFSSHCTLWDRDGLRSWQWVPRQLVQARV